MIGVFVQVNEGSSQARNHPIGYVIEENGCWDWVGGRNAEGYGIVTQKGRRMLAHRYTYEADRGPVPAGLELDHLCRNRQCVNPSHLEAVTHRENVLRGEGLTAQNAKKSTCPNGHPLKGGNLTTYGLKIGERDCRICQVDQVRTYRARRRASGADAIDRTQEALARIANRDVRCPNGHLLVPENVERWTLKKGQLRCIECKQGRARKRYHRQRGAHVITR